MVVPPRQTWEKQMATPLWHPQIMTRPRDRVQCRPANKSRPAYANLISAHGYPVFAVMGNCTCLLSAFEFAPDLEPACINLL
mmetsp:Transcript_123889/g.241304  ORF Transcript_123889/g.241304 Transcript_123889/m.241304 type:complete len:82 (-) Transcript_123889:1344-1589(-)